MTPILAALAISLAANGLLGWAYLGARDDVTVAEAARDQARGAAKQCSDATEKLKDQAAKRKKEAATAIAAAAKKAKDANERADAILSKPPSHPGDDCKSAQTRVDSWWEGRKP